MGAYKTLIFIRETGEVIYEKIYLELFAVDGITKASREIRLIYYCSRRFNIDKRNLGVISELIEKGGVTMSG